MAQFQKPVPSSPGRSCLLGPHQTLLGQAPEQAEGPLPGQRSCRWSLCWTRGDGGKKPPHCSDAAPSGRRSRPSRGPRLAGPVPLLGSECRICGRRPPKAPASPCPVRTGQRREPRWARLPAEGGTRRRFSRGFRRLLSGRPRTRFTSQNRPGPWRGLRTPFPEPLLRRAWETRACGVLVRHQPRTARPPRPPGAVEVSLGHLGTGRPGRAPASVL